MIYKAKTKKTFSTVCDSIISTASFLGVRPEYLSRDEWRRNKEADTHSHHVFAKIGTSFAECRDIAEECVSALAAQCVSSDYDGRHWPEDVFLSDVRKLLKERIKSGEIEIPERAERVEITSDPVEVFGHKRTITDLRAQNKQLLKQILEIQAREDLLLDMKKSASGIPVVQERNRCLVGKRQGIAKCFLSDVHFEEVIDESQVLWSNEYNPDIAEKRLDNLVDGILWKTNCHRAGYDITQLIQTFGGDMITGYLHLDNRTTNAMPPLEAILRCKDALIEYLLAILDNGDFEKITVCCVCGNHGRNTDKMVHKNFVKNNYEWLMYHIIADQLANEERFEFLVSTGGHLYSRVFDYVQRDLHGTEIGFQGGVGGITIPLNKAIANWDRSIKADATWYGHYHSYLPHPHAIGNGSLCGFNEYAQNRKFPYEPPQQAYGIIDSNRGLRDVVALWVDSKWDHRLR